MPTGEANTADTQADAPPEATAARVAFAERVRQRREAAGLTRRELSAHAGLSAPEVSAWEQCRTGSSLQSCRALARALAVSLGWLAFGEGQPEDPPPTEPPLPEHATFARRLEAAREQRRWSRVHLARLAGIDARIVTAYERGQRNADRLGLDRYVRIATALRVSPRWLAWGEGQPEP